MTAPPATPRPASPRRVSPGPVPVLAALREAWRHSRARLMATAGLLGAACVAWAAVPVRAAGPAGPALVVVAACCVAAGTGQLAVATLPEPDPHNYSGIPGRAGQWFLAQLRQVPWAEGTVLAALVLEVLHPARPWHTAVLGVALLGYLLGTHLAEADPAQGTAGRVLRAQLPVLAAGLGLLVLAAASTLLPGAGTGAAGAWLRTLAALAAVLAAGLALPV